MTLRHYELINDFIEERSIQLMINEKKGWTQSRFPLQNYIDYYPYETSPKYFVATTNIFKGILFDENCLAEIASTSPEYFETGNACDVLQGILQNIESFKSTYEGRICDFASLISKAHGYLIKFENEIIHPEILRIDLFRKLERSKKNRNNYDFVGGLFHSFKHFSINDINLSTGKESAELYHTLRIISYAKEAFFSSEREQTQKGFNSKVGFDNKYDLHFCFYEDKITKTFFITTIIKKGKI